MRGNEKGDPFREDEGDVMLLIPMRGNEPDAGWVAVIENNVTDPHEG